MESGRVLPQKGKEGKDMDAEKKKQLKNDYKSKLAVGAVYAIECSGNQRRCIKSTADIGGIRNRFNFALATKSCPEPALQSEWVEYGSEAFSLIILEELKMKEGQTAKEFAEDIKLLHELWLDKLTPGELK